MIWVMPAGTTEDYLEVDGPCVDGRRERTLAPLQPQICLDRGAIFANTTVLPCAVCQPGSHPTGVYPACNVCVCVLARVSSSAHAMSRVRLCHMRERAVLQCEYVGLRNGAGRVRRG